MDIAPKYVWHLSVTVLSQFSKLKLEYGAQTSEPYRRMGAISEEKTFSANFIRDIERLIQLLRDNIARLALMLKSFGVFRKEQFFTPMANPRYLPLRS